MERFRKGCKYFNRVKGVIILNRVEFLDILRDYLKGSFSEEEIGDILRDYEEYFLDGTIEGKSDIEIIKSLGSPKTIASELIAETKNKYNKVKF